MDKFVEAIRNEYKEVERQEQEAAAANEAPARQGTPPSPVYGPSDQGYFQDRERINVGWKARGTDCSAEVDTLDYLVLLV